MTEYWVSQGNKWCDFCKIYIANNPLSIRTHELGQRHKDSVTKRLASMRKENAAKEKEQKDAARAFEQVEAKAKRSYQKDLAAFGETREAAATAAASSSQASKEEAPKRVSSGAGEKPPAAASSKHPMRSSTPSSIAVNKRKRADGKPKVVSKEETEALRAREAAKKRMEEREKPLHGLYRSY